MTLHTNGLRTLQDVRDFLDGSRQIDPNVPNQAAAPTRSSSTSWDGLRSGKPYCGWPKTC